MIRNDAFERHANLYSGGLNLNYEGESGFNAFLDIGYSRTDRNELILESYSGTGFGAGNGARDTIGFQATERGIVFDPTLNYSDTNLIKLTDPQGWGGGVRPAGRLLQQPHRRRRALAVPRPGREGARERLPLGREGRRQLHAARKEPGLRTRRSSGSPAARSRPRSRPQFLQDPTNLDYLGLGPMVSYDPRDLLAAGNIYSSGLEQPPTATSWPRPMSSTRIC